MVVVVEGSDVVDGSGSVVVGDIVVVVGLGALIGTRLGSIK